MTINKRFYSVSAKEAIPDYELYWKEHIMSIESTHYTVNDYINIIAILVILMSVIIVIALNHYTNSSLTFLIWLHGVYTPKHRKAVKTTKHSENVCFLVIVCNMMCCIKES